MVFDKFLVDEFSPIAIYNTLSSLFPSERMFLFESVINNTDGNYSFIFIGEKERVSYKDYKTYYFDGEKEEVLDKDPFSFFKEYYSKIDKEKYKKLSRELKIGFVDGFVGYIGYDMVKVFEPVLKPVMDNLKDETDIPDLYMIRPKIVVGFSHKSSELTVIINDEKYEKHLYVIRDSINSTYKHLPIKPAKILEEPKFVFSKEKFFEMVKNAKENIKAGDIFQIVLSNRLKVKAIVDRFSFYRKLRSKNPSPYLYYLDIDDFAIVGSSPEVMVRLNDDLILLRPIAGTRKRGATLKEDLEMEHDMINDPKEVAEHIMLVDLGRNDVGRVAKAGSVKVEELMRVERYSHVMHMVSDVVGELDSKYDMFDLFKATFTAGTMTGAPKIKAMELIAKYEGLKRGYYAGSIGYFGFDGNMDSAITIRTALIKDDEVIFQAGAGVVADSKPELEYKEVNNKLGALVATLKDLDGGN
ncbi:anthranilate synthase component I family protein [Caminibacter pacificus]|jgi:anthranilate synthase component 1|uniref:Anthranilate synthase component 1 n=1 Tax=Caminibacter pacificus TaxID=1424653 RepID=A0AAJ4RE15_9BACT|nr:anthranilate synthase component I family protein [Caminibacter pacificus]NPA87419.1 anthranilate synthase component I family protein [Campylobacterota bacterium]QCI28420.1 anthranilate synthase component I family protein [Caminibacter pacificus]ROR40856.1 anthranilate synthase component 1 [Caminibacter pacificus]